MQLNQMVVLNKMFYHHLLYLSCISRYFRIYNFKRNIFSSRIISNNNIIGFLLNIVKRDRNIRNSSQKSCVVLNFLIQQKLNKKHQLQIENEQNTQLLIDSNAYLINLH
jgi:hypothetical protein